MRNRSNGEPLAVNASLVVVTAVLFLNLVGGGKALGRLVENLEDTLHIHVARRLAFLSHNLDLAKLLK